MCIHSYSFINYCPLIITTVYKFFVVMKLRNRRFAQSGIVAYGTDIFILCACVSATNQVISGNIKELRGFIDKINISRPLSIFVKANTSP